MDYSNLDLSALRAYARKQGVGVTTKMSRDQLIKAIENKSVNSKTTNKKTGPSSADKARKNIEDAIMGAVKDTPAYKAHFGNGKKSGGKYHPDNEKMDLSKVRGIHKLDPEKAPRLKDASGTSTVLKEKSGSSTRLNAKSNVPTPRKRPAGSTTSKPVSNVPTPRKRPAGSTTSTTTKAAPAKTSGSTLKNNMSMDKDKMANSIAAARKRGEGYYFDKKSGKKQLAIYKNDMKEGESVRDTANRLLGLKRKK